MQSPENVQSSKISHFSSNSKLHTPCRQIGLRRKKSRVSNTPIKENKSPEIKAVKESDHMPTTPTFVNISDHVVSVATIEEIEHMPTTADHVVGGESKTEEKCRLQKAIEDKMLAHAVVKSAKSQDMKKEVEVVKKRIKEKEEKIAALKLENANSQDVKKEVEVVKKRIKEKEEKIAALKLAKLYRKKHDTNTLSELTERWREGCQVALQELLSSSTAHGYQVNMTQLISKLGIPFHLIRYNPDLEDFE